LKFTSIAVAIAVALAESDLLRGNLSNPLSIEAMRLREFDSNASDTSSAL
jgi:hypothetical protein